MSALVDSILERPKNQKIAIWAGSILVVVLIFWQFIYGPVGEKQSALEKEVAELRSQVTTEQRMAANLEKFREEVKVLQGTKELAIRQLPIGRDLPGILSSLETLAKDAGLDVIRVNPSTEDELRDYYAEIPIAVELVGSFHQLVVFFDELSRMSRIVSVSGIQLAEPSGYKEQGKVRIKVKCTISAYRQLSEEEKGAKAKGDDAKAGSGKGKKGKGDFKPKTKSPGTKKKGSKGH